MENLGKWKCNFCGDTKGVTNGICPTDGAVQTTPIDEDAKKLGGFYEAEEEKKKIAEATALEEKESTATDGPIE